MAKQSDSTVAAAAIPGIFLITAVMMVWWSYALQVLWGWFVVPTFGLPELSLAAAVGLRLVFATAKGMGQQPKETQGYAHEILLSVIGPAIGLLSGWIAKQFM